MIKIERRLTDRAQGAIKSLETAKAKGTTYNTDQVNAALREMFHGKCYICENKEITSYQIEHLIAHRGNKDLKEYVREYKEAEGAEKEDLLCLLKQQLSDNSPFAAFKRWLIRDHKEAYPELIIYLDFYK